MRNSNYAILLAGGQGSRFWPQSRTLEPKQFLSFHNHSVKIPQKNYSLFEETIKRVKGLIPSRNIFIVTLELYRNQIDELILPLGVPLENVIFEPEPKNTAPCIGAAIRLASLFDADAKICVLPCDHMIRNKKRFSVLLKNAFKLCADNLVIFGIPPSRPATGYGYIRVAGSGKRFAGEKIYRVGDFIEKPDFHKAEKIFADKRHFWNSGIFLGSSRIFLEEIKKYLPDLYQQLLKVRRPQDLMKIWQRVKPISFDYGVLEKSKRILMIRADNLGWSDLGSWQAWDEILDKDNAGNKFIGDVVNIESRNVTVLGSRRLIATIALNDLIVVDTADALLITRKDKSEEVKKIVGLLKKGKRQEHYSHRTVKRPWGSYTVLEEGRCFKVKLIEVRPYKALSLQFHKKRSEHWVVIDGEAEIIKDGKRHYVSSNESIFIPAHSIHRLINPARSALKIIEVQSGDYLGEDDIVRLKDDFGRHNAHLANDGGKR